MNDDMTRYQLVYNNYPTYLHNRVIMLGQYYIDISYEEQITKISALEACILKDTIVISMAMNLDLNDIPATHQKIKTLMVFS